MTYRLSQKAQEDVEDIYRYSYENFGERQADNYHDELFKWFAVLGDSPMYGRPAVEYAPELRRLEYASHVIFYLPEREGQVLIVRVLHGSMDPGAHL